MVNVENLSCFYGSTQVLKELSFSLDSGELLAVIGPNGCGKTTLLHGIMGFLSQKGSVALSGKNISSLSAKERAKEVALLSQHSTIEFPYTVFDTVLLGRYCHKKHFFSQTLPEDLLFVEECLKNVDLLPQKDKLISALSGGQLQRVFLARTFAQKPNLILLDEPTNHLDLKVQLELFHQLKQWVSQEKRGIIGVFHDLNVVHQFADKVLLIHQGEGLAFGTPQEVLHSPLLEKAYELDVTSHMTDSYRRWANL